jgi:eukaryotic-like serine/threonine-protein kinase
MFGFGKKQPDDGDTLTQPIPAGWAVVDLGLLGAGGMSRVYRVRDETLGREVAFKVLRPDLAKHDSAQDAFIEEARITAQLDHPNIPAVYALAADKKRSTCFTMKVLEGKTLQQVLEENEREGVDGLSAALDVLVRVCDAVSFAHARGVLHLDLKPSNVMVGEFGQIYVVDWGLAKRKSQLSRDNSTNGTPAYMAPEQARGLNHQLDERADVFALGGILFRALTGRPPRHNATVELAAKGLAPTAESMERAGDAPLPRRLVAICLHALAPEPKDRFATVADFKRELEEFIRGTAQLPRLTFAPGEVMVREGDAADAAYIVLEGECQAERGVGVLRHELRRMGPGEMFGETAVLTRNPRSATVTAVTSVTVAVVDSLYLQEEMEKSSFMALAIRTVAERFLDLNEETATFRIQKRQAQVVDLMLRHLALDGVQRDGATRTAWKPLLASLVKQTQLPEAEVEAELLRQKGLVITGDELVLSR